MPPHPPLPRDVRKSDAGNLKLLAIFHFVFAGFSLLAIGGLVLHYIVLHTVMTNPAMFQGPHGGPPPPDPELFFAIFRWFYFVMGAVMVLTAVANLISGLCLLRRKARVYSMVVAGFDCVAFPFGTVLGVFTIILLARDSVRELYESGNRAGPPTPLPPPIAPTPTGDSA